MTSSEDRKTVALVTGGNNGIGLEICTTLAAQGSFHVIMGSRSLKKGQDAINSIQSRDSSSSISLVQLDVTSNDSIAAAVKHIESTHNQLDILVNNAGIISLDADPRTAYRDTMDTNAVSPALLTDALVPLLRKSQKARLIYITSGLGSIGLQSDHSHPMVAVEYSAYRMSKAALNMLVAHTSFRHREDGFLCFAFCPGYVISDLAGERESKERSGRALSPDTSAHGVLKIAMGERDAEAGGFLEGTDGQYPW